MNKSFKFYIFLYYKITIQIFIKKYSLKDYSFFYYFRISSKNIMI